MASSAQKSGPRAELFVLSGPDVGRSFEIFPGAALGRAPDRAVILRDKSISRHHAHFEFADGTWSIVDDGSTNGFVVDGTRRERAELTDLREFMIGELLVRLRTQISEAASSPAPPAARVEPAVSASADEIEIEDEILLDSAPPPTVVSFPKSSLASFPKPSAAPSPVTRAPSSPSTPRASTDAGFTAKGQRALQYHKQDARSGLFVTDLAQRPWWVRAALTVLALAIAAALAWAVYRGVLALREGASRSGEVEQDA